MGELMVKNDFSLAVLDGGEVLAAMREELGEGYQPELATAGIPAGGVTMFSIKRGKDDDDPEMVKALDGVIVCHHDVNAYWPDAYSGAGTTPACASRDGVSGMDAQTGEMLVCKTCPHNQFGSEIKQDGTPGRGKACKNQKRVYILRDGEFMPTLFNLPPTAIKAFNDYVFTLLMPKSKKDASLRPWQVVTHVELKQQKNAGGIAYATPTFKVVGVLPSERMGDMQAYAASFKAQAQGFVLTDEADPFQ